MLVHPGTNYIPDLSEGVRADEVFLGTAFLATARRRGFAEDYWAEVVRATGARLVIPIHSDNFMRPFSDPVRPLVRGSHERAMQLLRSFACRDGIELVTMQAFEPLDLRAAPERLQPVGPSRRGSECPAQPPAR